MTPISSLRWHDWASRAWPGPTLTDDRRQQGFLRRNPRWARFRARCDDLWISPTIRRGGVLVGNCRHAHPAVQDRHARRGRMMLMARYRGLQTLTDIDAYRPDVGFVVRTSLDLSSARIQETAIPSSHVEVRMTQPLPLSAAFPAHNAMRGPGRTALRPCRAAYLASTRPSAEWNVDGKTPLGDTIHLHDLHVGKRPSSTSWGRVSLRGVDLGLLARLRGSGAPTAGSEPGATAWGGQLWANSSPTMFLWPIRSRAKARFVLGPTVVSRGGQRLIIKPPPEPLSLASDTLTIPPFEVTLDTPAGFRERSPSPATSTISRVTRDWRSRRRVFDGLVRPSARHSRAQSAVGHVQGDVDDRPSERSGCGRRPSRDRRVRRRSGLARATHGLESGRSRDLGRSYPPSVPSTSREARSLSTPRCLCGALPLEYFTRASRRLASGSSRLTSRGHDGRLFPGDRRPPPSGIPEPAPARHRRRSRLIRSTTRDRLRLRPIPAPLAPKRGAQRSMRTTRPSTSPLSTCASRRGDRWSSRTTS